MAIKNTPTTLGSLEFSQIKQNLIDYMKNQSVFSGYNFEGSAIQSIIDLLAYNTFYYAYYANMINAEAFLDSAQKEDSIISLCKPLGYTVPSRTAAVARIFTGGLTNSTIIPAGTKFTAATSDGINYGFYNLEDIGLSEGNSPTDGFDVYQANNYVNFNALPTFDFTNQKISIVADGFDLNSIKVTITETISETVVVTNVWTQVGNVGYTARVDENIYFVERTSTGFAILFGGINSVGRTIDDKIVSIQIRYITTDGSDANGLPLFTSGAINGQVPAIQLISESKNGKKTINFDTVRFLAPKWFAAQERAVTVNDYKALLLQSGLFESETDFNVFGGQDLTPPKYGRVFVSSNLDPLDSGDDLRITTIINFLKERSVITVLPEYTTNITLNLYTNFNFRLGPGTPNTTAKKNSILASVKAIFDSNFKINKSYNAFFSASDFIQTLRDNTNPEISSLVIYPENFDIYLSEKIVGDKDYLYNLQNEFYLNAATYLDITDPFESNLLTGEYVGRKGILRMYVPTNSAKNNKVNLKLFARDTNTGEENEIQGDFGYFIANKGVLYIPAGIIKQGTDTTLNLTFARSTFSIGLNNLISFNYNSVTII